MAEHHDAPPPSFSGPAVPRPWPSGTHEASASPILLCLSRPRIAELRLTASRYGTQPRRAGDAASVESGQRPPAEAAQRRGEKGVSFSYPSPISI